jgi:hypothetical protein
LRKTAAAAAAAAQSNSVPVSSMLFLLTFRASVSTVVDLSFFDVYMLQQ